MPQLEFSTLYSQIFWLSLSFLATFLVVNYLFVPKIAKILIERRHNISHNLRKSEAAVAMCRKMSEELELVLNKARYQAATLLDEASVEAKNFLEKEIEEMEKNMATKEMREFERLGRYEAQLRSEIPVVSAGLSQEVLHKLKSLCELSREITN